ncbi:MAG: M48 family metalloprotease [Candidatus Latescibacteria bacterium]|nr:M48 family metalloprotease [Candidatus Latescibacterota bacterium]
MMDLLFQVGLSNVCISLVLATVALLVEVTLKRPHLAYLLWLSVFVKLLTPSLVAIPIITFSGQPEGLITTVNDQWLLYQDEAADPIPGGALHAYLAAETWSAALRYGKIGLPLLWFLGSVLVFVGSSLRLYRFNRLLNTESEVAPPDVQQLAARLAGPLGLKTTPTIYTLSAHLSPMVWWLGGQVRIFIPTALLDQMDTRQFQWVLAHELAHVRRRDYLVRCLEWLTSILFWWNPVVWWARHYLRANEEICCDALVVSHLKPQPHTYAHSLLRAVEYLSLPVSEIPALASGINNYGSLERRFRMILSATPKRRHLRGLQACVLLCTAVVLPLSVTYSRCRPGKGRSCRAGPDA